MKLKDVTPYCTCRANFLAYTHPVRRDGLWIFGRNHSKVGKSAHWYRGALYIVDYKKERVYRLSWR